MRTGVGEGPRLSISLKGGAEIRQKEDEGMSQGEWAVYGAQRINRTEYQFQLSYYVLE